MNEPEHVTDFKKRLAERTVEDNMSDLEANRPDMSKDEQQKVAEMCYAEDQDNLRQRKLYKKDEWAKGRSQKQFFKQHR